MTADILQLIINAIIAIAGITGVYYTARHAMKTQLTGAYFSEMTNAYAGYLKAVDDYVYHPDQVTTDALSSSLHRLLLFASLEICDYANNLYVQVTDWSRDSHRNLQVIDAPLNKLGNLMKTDLMYFRVHGDHRPRG